MIGGLIFARMLSTRLPSKVIIEIQGKTILEHVIARVMRSNHIKKVVVATTTNPKDDAIKRVGLRLGLDVFRGAEVDVLDRCYQAAKTFCLDPIVRITADDPFKDPDIIDYAIGIYLRSMGKKYDLVCNTLKPTFPEGLDVEVISFNALERVWKESCKDSDREHVTMYMLEHPEQFLIYNFENTEFLSDIRLTLDTKEDLELVKAIYDALYPRQNYFSWKDVIDYLSSNPDLLKINENVKKSNRYLCSDKK
jgi:spore coat polysaccharide biosynthesis protein SpsF